MKPGRIQGRDPGPLLFLDQTESRRRAEKNFLGDRPLPFYLRVWMTAPPIPLSQALDPALGSD